ISFAFVIAFTYFQNSKSILESSKETAVGDSTVILEKTGSFFHEIEGLARTSSAILGVAIDPTLDNKDLRNYLLHILYFHDKLYAIYMGKPDGSSIAARSLILSHKTHYVTDPGKPLPPGAVYEIVYRAKPTSEAYTYVNAGYEVLGNETISNASFDPRKRPWY